jgi:2-C-methyl-D-erythritol 4-phosphate cytidylyltransferase
MEQSALIDGVVPVVPEDLLDYFREEFAGRWPFKKVIGWVAGGARRQDSVAAGLKELPGDTAWVVVHDAARPFVDEDCLTRLLEKARETGAAVPGVIPTDTVKEVDGSGVVKRTISRDALRRVQTPQVFAVDLLKSGYERALEDGKEATDDASLVEFIGGTVAVIEGSWDNIKITREEDLPQARFILKARTGKAKGGDRKK